MVHGKVEKDIWDLVKMYKSYILSNQFCLDSTLVEYQAKLVLQFMEFDLELDTNYDVIDGISKETFIILGENLLNSFPANNI